MGFEFIQIFIYTLDSHWGQWNPAQTFQEELALLWLNPQFLT